MSKTRAFVGTERIVQKQKSERERDRGAVDFVDLYGMVGRTRFWCVSG